MLELGWCALCWAGLMCYVGWFGGSWCVIWSLVCWFWCYVVTWFMWELVWCVMLAGVLFWSWCAGLVLCCDLVCVLVWCYVVTLVSTVGAGLVCYVGPAQS